MKIRRAWIDDPPETLVKECCKNCPLLASKPGNEQRSKAILAAVNSAARLKQLIDAKIAPLIFKDPHMLSARRVAALLAYNEAEARSERNRFPKEKTKDPKKVGYVD